MNNSKEIWRDVQGYKGLYQVSNLGRIKSLYRNGLVLRGSVNNSGYRIVMLYKGGKHKNFLIHRLVAQTFIPNPEHLLQVNHKDENKSNNSVNNLEWCTNRYNNLYHDKAKRTGIKEGKPVAQYTLSGKLIKVWRSSHEAEKAGYHARHIGECCSGKIKTHQGYIWRFALGNKVPDVIDPYVKRRFTNRKDLSQPIGQYDLNGYLIKTWPSMREASRAGFDKASIAYHLKNHKPYKGYVWKRMN